jgi:hypothetical protein
VILNRGLDQHRIDVDADHIVPETGQFSRDATRATARIEDARPTPNHRVKQTRLSSQVATGCRHRTEALDVPGRVGWVRRHLLHPPALFRHVCIVPPGTPSLVLGLPSLRRKLRCAPRSRWLRGMVDVMSRQQRVTPSWVSWPLSERLRRRQRWYFALMGVCLVLILLAWNLVRLWSTTAAVVMSVVAAVLPPIAVIIANWGEDR